MPISVILGAFLIRIVTLGFSMVASFIAQQIRIIRLGFPGSFLM
jgi:hypothetical protein